MLKLTLFLFLQGWRRTGLWRWPGDNLSLTPREPVAPLQLLMAPQMAQQVAPTQHLTVPQMDPLVAPHIIITLPTPTGKHILCFRARSHLNTFNYPSQIYDLCKHIDNTQH